MTIEETRFPKHIQTIGNNSMNKPEIVSITQSLVGEFSAEEYIAHVARVSNPENQFNNETAGKLLVHLLKKQHWSPFDMVDLTFKIETSKAVAIQILRHNSFRFQEFSQRYSEVKNLDFSDLEIRGKAIGGNRQGSGERMDEITETAKEFCDKSELVYNYCLGLGAAPESARMILPMATPTKMYMKGSIRSWITYFWGRCHKDSQKEHRELALQMLGLFCEKFPLLGDLIKNNRPQIIEQDWLNEKNNRGRVVAITSTDGGERAYEYDERGQLISETHPNGEKYTYERDDLGRMISMEYPNGKKIKFEYDGKGNLISETWHNGKKITF